MNRLQLLRLLRRHIKLSERRSPMYEQNRWAKFFVYLMGCFGLVYMIFIAVLLSIAANETNSYTPCEFLYGLLPFFLMADFDFRFIGQQTPAQLIKPYSLLPIPKYACVECFIFSSVITPNNFIWTAITIPYAIMTTLFHNGLFVSLGLILSFQLMFVINSQWYMLARTLINKNALWWLLPIGVYALLLSPLYFDKFADFFEFFSLWGDGFAFWHPLWWLAGGVVLWVFIEINKRVQFRLTYIESNNAAGNAKLRTVSEFRVLDKYGEVGEYLKLEVKSLMRNKNIRKTFIFEMLFMLVLSLVISFTDLYQNSFLRVFWVVYNFVLFGATLLVKIMCGEGNYIDGLMVHKENIVQLLKAKYYFYSTLLVLPFLLMLPTVFTGKYSLLMLVSMMCFAAGPVYCLLMQLAVYNRQTMPLNSKFIGKGSIESNYFQVVAELGVMFAPVAFISLLRAVFSETMVYVILLLIGLAFIAAHNVWIHNIYRRFMARRYANMEGFRASR